MTGGEEQKKEEPKGFAGLSSLVSDVDTTPPPTPKKESAAAAPSAERPASPQPTELQPQPNQRQTYQKPSQPSSESSGGKWMLGVAAVVGLFWLIGQSNKATTSSAPAYSQPTQPQVPYRPQESLPPVGQGLTLSRGQIAYCVAEDIRLEGAKSAIDNFSGSDVNQFNTMVADYNNRCSNFRYRRGVLESVRQDIETYRNQLYSEGQQRFLYSRPRNWSSNTSSAQPYRQADPPSAQPYQKCEYKRVMNDDDYRACGISPPRY